MFLPESNLLFRYSNYIQVQDFPKQTSSFAGCNLLMVLDKFFNDAPPSPPHISPCLCSPDSGNTGVSRSGRKSAKNGCFNVQYTILYIFIELIRYEVKRLDTRIPDDVLKETTECPYQFSCIDNHKCGNQEQCSVDYADGKNMLFLVTTEYSACTYRLSYGHYQICRCPTRYALHNLEYSIKFRGPQDIQ